MHIILTTIVLVTVAHYGVASQVDTTGLPPVAVVEIVGSSAAHSSVDTVDAVIRCVLHEPDDVVELRLGSGHPGDTVQRSAESVQHRIRLDENLSGWVMVDGGYHRVSGVKPGVYNLRVQARYPGSAWGEEVRIHLHIERSHSLPWGLFGVLIALILPSAWLVRNRQRERTRQRDREHEQIRADERRRIARDLHDDVGSGLARIVVLSDAAAATDATNEVAATIAETAREVIDNVRTIVWVMKSENDSVAAMISYVRDRISELLRDHGIEFKYENELSGSCTMNAASRWNIMMCMKEIATNIVRHSKATTVRMHVSYHRGYLSIRISDNGIGFRTDAIGIGSGLAHIRDRMTEIGGTAGIGSMQDGGTNILLVIPADQQDTTDVHVTY